MSHNGTNSSKRLQEEIRRQFGSAGTTRFFHSLPAFRVDSDLPGRLSRLLEELDGAERDRHHGGSDRCSSRPDSDAAA